MDAGRELDMLVLEKVFGLERVTVTPEWLPRPHEVHCFYRPGDRTEMVYSWDEPFGNAIMFRNGVDDKAGTAQNVPWYSVEIEAAWEVVEKMRETHWTSVDGIGRPEQLWRATFEQMSDSETGERFRTVVQIAATAPLAICHAALLALGAAVPA